MTTTFSKLPVNRACPGQLGHSTGQVCLVCDVFASRESETCEHAPVALGIRWAFAKTAELVCT